MIKQREIFRLLDKNLWSLLVRIVPHYVAIACQTNGAILWAESYQWESWIITCWNIQLGLFLVCPHHLCAISRNWKFWDNSVQKQTNKRSLCNFNFPPFSRVYLTSSAAPMMIFQEPIQLRLPKLLRCIVKSGRSNKKNYICTMKRCFSKKKKSYCMKVILLPFLWLVVQCLVWEFFLWNAEVISCQT